MEKAKEALYRCRNASTIDEFASNWSTYLINTGGIVNALHRGSRVSPEARLWYDSVAREQEGDPLLSYMRQARNVEEHALESLTSGRPTQFFGLHDPETGEVDWDMGTDWGSGQINADGSVSYKRDPDYFRKHGNRHFAIGASPTGPTLRPAIAGGRSLAIWPPTTHFGKTIKTDPLSVAELYQKYLAGLISKAEAMC